MTCPTTNLEVKLTGKIPWMCAIVVLVLKRGSKVLDVLGLGNSNGGGVRGRNLGNLQLENFQVL